MSTSTKSNTLSTFVSLLNDVQAADKALREGKSLLSERKREARQIAFDKASAFEINRAEARVLIQKGRVAALESELKDAQRKYRKQAREVRVYKLDGTKVGTQQDGCRALQDAGVNECAYERQADANAAALYECGQLDF